MNRPAIAALAVSVALGFVAVSGVAATSPQSVSSAPAAPATADVSLDGARTPADDSPPNGSSDAESGHDAGTTIDTGNGTLRLDAAPNRTISGESDLDPGSELSIRIRSSDPASPFLRTAEATVAADGTWTTTVDLGTVGGQPTFTITVSHDGERLVNATGQVVGEPTAPLGEFDSTDGTNVSRIDTDDTETPPVANATFESANGTLRVANATGQLITGETDLAPGRLVTVRLMGTGANPFLRTAPTQVGENGTFGATFNLTTVPANTTFEAVAVYDGQRIGNRSGVVEACTGDCVGPAEQWLVQNLAFARQGQQTDLTLALPGDTDTVTLVAGGGNTTFRLETLVRDTSDDGRVTLAFDTAATGVEEQRPLTAAGEDTATIRVEAALGPPLDVGTYDLAVYRGDEPEGTPIDVGTLVVGEPRDGTATDRGDDSTEG